MTRCSLFLSLAVASCVGRATDSATVAASRRPNVILIMADDMGYECLRCNGGASYDSRLLDRLAANGMRFPYCYSQPICTPSRNKIMTGRSNARNYRAFGVLIPEEITFGNLMQQAGYKTCIAGKWQLSGGEEGNDDKPVGTTPQKCGFDESCMWAYVHDLPKGVQHQGGWEKPGKTSRYWNPSIVQNGAYRPTGPDDYGPDIYSGFVVDFLRRHAEEEFFVYYPMTLTHGPFLPTPHSPDLKRANRYRNNGRYFSDMVAYAGHCVDRIVQELDALGIAENTLVLFTGDNGTHRSLASMLGDRNVPGGKGLPVDAGCHVPMIAYWKGTIQPGSICTDLIDFSDFVPTIVELGDASLPTDRVIDGRSFLPQLRGEAGTPRTSVVVHYDKDPQKAAPEFRRVRFAYDGRFKLYLDGSMFEVPLDWEEEHPIDAAAMGDAARAARSKLQEALDALPPWRPDNSAFGDGPDAATLLRRQLLRNEGP